MALFSIGLRENSRTMMKLNNQQYTFEQLTMAKISDCLSILLWRKTKDGQKGKNKPKLITDLLLNVDKVQQNQSITFSSGEEFEKARNELLKKGG